MYRHYTDINHVSSFASVCAYLSHIFTPSTPFHHLLQHFPGISNPSLPASFSQSPASPVGHFGSNLSSSALGVTSQTISSPFLQPHMLRSNLGPVQNQFLPGSPQRVFGVQTTQPRPLFGNFTGQAGLQQSGPSPPMSEQLFPSASETNSNYNPFL